MENLNIMNSALPALAVVLGISSVVERFTEILLSIVFTLVKDFKPIWEEKLSGGIKIVLTFVFNGGLYALFFTWDFATPFMSSLGVAIRPWQGLLLSVCVVAAGSQYAHQFFGFFGKKPEAS